MKKSLLLIPLSLLAVGALVACGPKGEGPQTSSPTSSEEPLDEDTSLPDPSGNVDGGTEHNPITTEDTPEQPEVTNTKAFSLALKTEGEGAFTNEGNVYTITAAGTYVAKGKLDDGQIVVVAGENDVVELSLEGAIIACSTDSPIKVVSADKLEISAKKNSSNKIIDNRAAKTVDNEALGEGAISAKCDLKLKGTGTLVVEGHYNNGVHTTKDLTIQKEVLHVTAVNNALKGKASITIVSGTVTAISTKGNGLKTDLTDLSGKGKQRGKVIINGGTLVVDAAQDGIDAAYDVLINEETLGDDDVTPLGTSVSIKTGTYSSNAANYSSQGSAKGIKADNNITIAGGKVAVYAKDDAIHANYGTPIASGEAEGVLGEGTINVTGGKIGIKTGDDGIHADHTLTVEGGIIDISEAKEGLEATHVKIKGGSTSIYGSDDGVNASQKINDTENPSVEISGGFLDVAMAAGDTDGIDSNGTFTMTGGLVVTRGSYGNAQRMSTGLDVDMACKMSGGTLIAFNGLEKKPTYAADMCYAYYGSQQGSGGPGGPGPGWAYDASSYKFAAGVYTLAGGGMTKTFENVYQYNSFLVLSSEMSVGTQYTLSLGETTVLSWTQSARAQEIK